MLIQNTRPADWVNPIPAAKYHLVVIGAGPIGCEMAQSFARFGSEVYLVEALHGVLPREDRDAAGVVQAKLSRDGVKLLCCGKGLKLSKAPSGVRMQVESHGTNYDVVVDQLLVAVGRAPNVEGMGLETVGVEFDKKGVKVNDRLQTANSRIFACGDICSPYQFTHTRRENQNSSGRRARHDQFDNILG